MNFNGRIFFCFILINSFSCIHGSTKKNSVPIIYEGKGLDKIYIGIVNRDSLKDIFSPNYDSINYGNYSIAIHYPNIGAYFYYHYNDDSSKIFAMAFDSSFKGITSKGFRIKDMTVKDMISIYGRPKWQELESELNAHYDSLGIYFTVKPINIPEPNFYANVKEDDNQSDSLAELQEQNYYSKTYLNSRVETITIGIPGKIF